ncbi:MAG: N-acetylmuramoyl-L-alanine amidase [Desulfosporosinus sp.]|nr:N-acetylmuramoyl-L-alanine amidase [Desulfosporosinus sp.]
MLLGLLLTFWLLEVAIASATPLSCQTTRVFGDTRIETAIHISQIGWQQAGTVLIARADDFPDSLVSVPLSHRLNAPILLTYPAQLEPSVLTEIKRLGAKHVILMGGAGVLGPSITKSLEQAGLTWEQIGGTNRYETAALVAERLGMNGQVIIANGENFPDALAIDPYAGFTETPILLVNAKEMPAETAAALQNLSVNGTQNGGEGTFTPYVIGGEGVIPSAILSGVQGYTRIAGSDRYETAAKVYWFTQTQLGDTATNSVYLVTGEDFPDALVAGALAAKQGTSLFMSAKNTLPPTTYSALRSAAANGLAVTMVGGSSVLSDKIKGMLEGTVQPPYLLAGVTIVVDPGHGGQDTGAIGAAGTYEKNNTLPTALDLADLLRSAGANVVLTRSTDTLPTGVNYTELSDLKARVAIAAKNKADIYVSIHNDSFSNPDVYGTTTYYSSSNPQADKSNTLAKDLQKETISILAPYKLGLNENRGVKDAPDYVIKYTSMPAVLIELGFISNPVEEKNLGSSVFQKQAALGIYQGILDFKL